MNMLLVLLFFLTSFVNSLYVVPNSRSLTDSLADQDEFPYVASIQIKDVHVCSGFIYNENSIVTSASCVHGVSKIDLLVTLGQLSLINEDKGEETFPVRHVAIHPDYDSVSKKHNLALLQLTRTIKFGSSVQCITCGMADQQSSSSKGTIAGWGSIREGGLLTTVLRKDTAFPIPGDCRPYQTQYDRNFMICAGDDFHSPCHYDEGSPLVQNNAVVGIFSFNRGCGIDQIASIFTNISAYFPWLNEEAGEQSASCIKNS